MILLVHKNAQTVHRAFLGQNAVELKSKTCVPALWELAERFPDEVIGWCDITLHKHLAIDEWEKIFPHDLIMASYSVKTKFLPDTVGYIDQLPFVNINRKVVYGTWLMSSDCGGIKGKVILKFRPVLKDIRDFNFLLNSLGKIGQQNGLFCYSVPNLVVDSGAEKLVSLASVDQLFEFVFRHYKSVWILVLFGCFFRYEKKNPLGSLLKAISKNKLFKKSIDLSNIKVTSTANVSPSDSIDVIIPTFGRPLYLMQVLDDLKSQSFLPTRVIVIEQNPILNSKTALPELLKLDWPFEIVHHFIHQTGACNARNMALEEVKSKWIFFADDDIRMNSNILEKALGEINKYNFCALNMNCKQEGERTVFHKIKQWGSFGSGTSIVKSSFARQATFSLLYEFGYGEDADYGMQLRNLGCDIIYHPEITIMHLKAPIGGLRKKPQREWEKERVLPKPSPTVMVFGLRYFTSQQLIGFKSSLFLKFYFLQDIRNPFTYIQEMRKRWENSMKWAVSLMRTSGKNSVSL